jgi:two-component SAPR family response regulator
MNNRVKSGNTLFGCFFFIFFLLAGGLNAKEIAENTFLIAGINHTNIEEERLWSYLQQDNNSGIEINLTETEKDIFITGSSFTVDKFIKKLQHLITINSSKILPVFINFDGDVSILDSVFSTSLISANLFFLPRGEAWPPIDYLIQANRRIVIFISGNIPVQSRIFHPAEEYILSLSAAGTNLQPLKTNLELLLIKDFEKLPVGQPYGTNIMNLVPDYINFLLETWKKYGKRPNFLFVNDKLMDFSFIIAQLNSFIWFNGSVKGAGKTFEKVYWKNPEISVTGGRFSFPYRGGEELTLTPLVPGYRMTPEQIIVTGEMEVPENYNIMAIPLSLSDGLTGSFPFNETVENLMAPEATYRGENYSFIQDIDRGRVLRLPENASINLGSPEKYGLRNSSFSVSCFVKFNEIMEFGDNAVLGNYESEYRRGLHLILRSGHPYFGLWANDYISEEKLNPNIWYHIVWRYNIDTGEQAIFLNGKNIGSSDGHPPFSGTGDIHLGSALSQGANLRGTIHQLHFWNRPLGSEEITRLSLNEPVEIPEPVKTSSFAKNFTPELFITLLVLILLIAAAIFLLRKRKPAVKRSSVALPEENSANQITLFGGFRATDREGNEVTGLFTPKVKELLLFTLLSTLKNGMGASASDIDEQLWPGTDFKNVSNNRAVTLNKLRKILQRIDGLEIITQNGLLQTKISEPFFCDYVEVYKLCHIAGGMNKVQLETFYRLVEKGVFLKGINWQWLDDFRGFTGNQIIDNLLKLALFYKNDKKLPEIEAIAGRILDYDDLNEEAVWLKVWCLRQRNNSHQAKFYFDSFISRYKDAMSENYPMTYDEFNSHFGDLIQGALSTVNTK